MLDAVNVLCVSLAGTDHDGVLSLRTLKEPMNDMTCTTTKLLFPVHATGPVSLFQPHDMQQSKTEPNLQAMLNVIMSIEA